jgi:LuxR family maltose regulon positive regulatory protein
MSADALLRVSGYELCTSKLSVPQLRPGTVRRKSLLRKLEQTATVPIVSIAAPAGYGKTMLLAQWAQEHPVAWISADKSDNDPKSLLAYLVQALDAFGPVDRCVIDALASGQPALASAAPRLGSVLATMAAPITIVVDDAHVLANRECWAVLKLLADHLPPSSRLALASRTDPPLAVARLRAEGKIAELGRRDLELTEDEAASVMRNAGVSIDKEAVADLCRRTEGWAVGLYFAAIYLHEGGSIKAMGSFGGRDRYVSEYMESEFLSRISPEKRDFLTRTAVLDTMSGALCDAVLGICGSGALLAKLNRSNLLIEPIDRDRQWYRHHPLFREMLLADLEQSSPEQPAVLRRRAADWCRRNAMAETAMSYLMAADDIDAVAHLVGCLCVPTYRQGRTATLKWWFQWLARHSGVDVHPMVAIAMSLVAAFTAKPADAFRWADTVERRQIAQDTPTADAATEGWTALLRAILSRHGLDSMRRDADEAAKKFAVAGVAESQASLMQGVAGVLADDFDVADAYLDEATVAAARAGAPETLAIALGERALVAMSRSMWSAAESFARGARQALSDAGIETSFATALVCAMRARVSIHRGDLEAARQATAEGERTRHLLTHALPHLAAQARIELARASLALRNERSAGTLLAEVDTLRVRRPGLGSVESDVRDLRRQLAAMNGAGSHQVAPTLTAAELKLLPMLSTHLTIPEIAEALYLSRHTIKSEAKSIYRKLGSCSRSEAIARSRDLGLLDR